MKTNSFEPFNSFERAVERAVGKHIDRIRDEPLRHRTGEDKSFIPGDSLGRYVTHKQAEEYLKSVLR